MYNTCDVVFLKDEEVSLLLKAVGTAEDAIEDFLDDIMFDTQEHDDALDTRSNLATMRVKLQAVLSSRRD